MEWRDIDDPKGLPEGLARRTHQVHYPPDSRDPWQRARFVGIISCKAQNKISNLSGFQRVIKMISAEIVASLEVALEEFCRVGDKLILIKQRSYAREEIH